MSTVPNPNNEVQKVDRAACNVSKVENPSIRCAESVRDNRKSMQGLSDISSVGGAENKCRGAEGGLGEKEKGNSVRGAERECCGAEGG